MNPAPNNDHFLFASSISGGGAHYSGRLVCGDSVCEWLHCWHHTTVSLLMVVNTLTPSDL
jgi:hypothetical protein